MSKNDDNRVAPGGTGAGFRSAGNSFNTKRMRSEGEYGAVGLRTEGNSFNLKGGAQRPMQEESDSSSALENR